MRKIIVGEFISLDGVVEAPDEWHFPYVDEEMMEVVLALADSAETMLLGRVTYQSYAGAFANAPADDPVAARMNRPAKLVVTQTLDRLEWANCSRLTGDVPSQVARLKDQPGGDILITGSTTLVRTLLRAQLVDELDLLIHPILVGSGKRLFEHDSVTTPLTLASNTTFGTGVIHAVYRKA